MSKGRGRPKGSAPARADRRPKAERPRSTAQDQPLFSFARVDTACDPRWAFDPSGEEARLILRFLSEMSRLTWAQIEAMRSKGHRTHHSQEVHTLDRDAQRDFRRARLAETFGDLPMFRFRLSGAQRLWGFREGQVFHAVWWDHLHQVYPVEPN